VLINAAGDDIIKKKPWVLCVPTRKCNEDAFKSVIQKSMRAELGWGKYLLLRPFMGKMRKNFVLALRLQAKTMLYEILVDRAESLSDEKRKVLKKAYGSRFNSSFDGNDPDHKNEKQWEKQK